jgi:catechol 2,3-dioxygenase-like lactoylglutathione lyase family enzyme
VHSRFSAAAFVVVLATAAVAQTSPARPKITGISHPAVYATDMAATDRYYRETLGAARLADPENPKGVRYGFNDVQFVEVLPLPEGVGIRRLDHIAFNTDDAEAMRKYLAAKSWKTPAAVTKGDDGSKWLTVADPEGNKVEFVQPPRLPKTVAAPNAIGRHLIHVGILVHDRALEDTFYRDLLGFRPYWWGGMTAARVDWVSQQTPDSHDWLEYMLESGPAGSAAAPAMTQRLLGVLNHVSIGVPSVDEAQKKLIAANRLSGVHDDSPKTGRDGKRQFNMYDPDQTRIELMNFRALEKPCCSPFTAEDPAE